jgi:hypothetical protein
MRRVILLSLFWLVCGTGCGYRVASKNRLTVPFDSVAVTPLENLTTYYQVEQILTRALINELVKSSGWDVRREPAKAQAVLEGQISRLAVSPLTFGRASFGSSFLVLMFAQVRLRDRSSGEILYENNDYVFREQYVINVEVENFFSEMNPALERISQDFATSLVANVLENF